MTQRTTSCNQEADDVRGVLRRLGKLELVFLHGKTTLPISCLPFPALKVVFFIFKKVPSVFSNGTFYSLASLSLATRNKTRRSVF